MLSFADCWFFPLSMTMARAAGITMEADDRVMREQAVCAVPEAKTCSVPAPLSPMLKTPPRKKHMPITRRRLERIDPNIEDLTTSI